MLGGKSIIGFIPSTDRVRAREFYEGVLGLTYKEDDGFATVLDANGVDVRLTNVGEFTPFPFTIFGWSVDDIVETVKVMKTKGVAFDRYDFLEQDDLDIWTAPDGARVAWFKDLDGNVLSVSQDSE